MLPSVGQGAALQTVTTSVPTGGATASGNVLSQQRDEKESQTAAKFGDVWKQIQSKYGAKPEKPKEIKKALGKDDFLRIMIMQMKNQDPTSPFKAEQFASELAQFTTVEQLQNMNQSLTKMTTQNQPLERLAMTNLIGKTVMVDRDRFPHTEGSNDNLSFNLPRDAASVHVTVVAQSGETMFEKDLGAMKAGAQTFTWDGVRSNTLPTKSGDYLFRVTAKDDKDQSIQTNPQSKTRVVGVSFESGEPVFLVGDLARPDKIGIRNVIRIEDGDEAMIPGARSMASANPSAPIVPAGQNSQSSQPAPNLISFQKGVGSTNLDSGALPPGALQALAKLQAERLGSAKPEGGAGDNAMSAPRAGIAAADGEKGFPSGLGVNNANE